jgi:hypothetical protein
MNRYRNLSGNSGVRTYAIREESIAVQFADAKTYVYSYASAGRSHIDAMKRLAKSGEGLATYINKHVRDRYEARLD